MKNQKGVTLISLTIYIIALTVIIAMLSLISTFFYKNVKDSQNDIEPLTEFTNFNSYFSTDANTSNMIYLTTGSGDNYSYVALVNKDTLNQENPEVIKYIYVSADKTIYRDTGNTSIAVARNVTQSSFTESAEEQQTNSSKKKITIMLTIGNSSKTYNYSLYND